MPELREQFEAAAKDALQLPSRPDNQSMLQLYSLYKQATAGDVTGSRPGMLAMVERAKYDAWTALRGMSKDSAMQSYVDLVERLRKGG